MSRTAILAGRIPGAGALTVGTNYVLSFGVFSSFKLNLAPLYKSPSGLATVGKNDAIWLDSMRIYCNFADGLVPTSTGPDMPIALWHGNSRVTPPANTIGFTTRILNEWFPVEMPVPRDESTIAVYGGLAVGIFGSMEYYTHSIESAFNGEVPFFEIQCRIKAAYI